MSVRFRLGVLLVGVAWGLYLGLPAEAPGAWQMALIIGAMPFAVLAGTAPLFGRLATTIVWGLLAILNIAIMLDVRTSKGSTAAVALVIFPLYETTAILIAAALAWLIAGLRRARWR